MKKAFRTLLAVLFLSVGSQAVAHADQLCILGVCIGGGEGSGGSGGTSSAPEIDASVASSGIVLLTGSMMMLRGRRKKQ